MRLTVNAMSPAATRGAFPIGRMPQTAVVQECCSSRIPTASAANRTKDCESLPRLRAFRDYWMAWQSRG
jgi:hypothetical protein